MQQLLIVEDERVLRRCLALFFRRRGFVVVEAGSIAEAEVLISNESFQVALVDVCLPDGSGLHLLTRIGAERTIAMTASPGSVARSDRAIPYLIEKPLDLEHAAELVARVAAC